MASPSAPFPQATLMHSGRNFKVEDQAAMDGEVCKMEGETRRRRKGKERAVNQERNEQQKNFFLEDESEEHHFNPFLPSSPNISNSSLPKTQIRTEVSRARWIEEIGMAEVIEKKGSLWGTTGVIRNSKLYCHIEEIGFLAQIGALVLLNEGDNIMDLKDILRKCADRRYGCTWESFEAYRHLKSLGYVVGRHGQPWSLKLDKVNSNSDLTADTDPDLIAGRVEELHIGAANLIFDIHRPNSRFKKSNPGVPSFVICLVGDRPPSRKEVEDLEKRCKSVPLKFCHVNHDNENEVIVLMLYFKVLLWNISEKWLRPVEARIDILSSNAINVEDAIARISTCARNTKNWRVKEEDVQEAPQEQQGVSSRLIL